MLWLSFTLLALLASVQGRAVNISNTWVLPEEGFPVFYRYFRDRISWYEADAVCQFHHANLVTVDTTAQYDAVRAYLKELDISSAVWVGLIRSNPDGDFTWTDYRGLSGEGYWSAAPDSRAAPLCAAADPAADYRWEARACGGPTVASFICELPVPQWALGNDGCMVRALPALTVLYLPESAAVQLTADCGLAGVKRVQCTGNVKRDELLKDLSCNDEEDQSSTLSLTSTSTMWPVTDTTLTDQETTTEDVSTEDTVEDTSITVAHITETATPNAGIVADTSEANTPIKQNMKPNDFVRIPLDKNIVLEQIHSNNIMSNEIPHPEHKESSIIEQRHKHIEDNKKFQHRLLHDEMSRLGNLDTIFTQPTDHFVPPLVMAKARISNDMTVLSLEEKHAQQVAEKRLLKHNLFEHVNITPPQTTTSNPKSTTTDVPIITEAEQEKTQSVPVQTLSHLNNLKKEVKSSVPKKYIDKYENPKAKPWKIVDYKTQKAEKIDVQSTVEIPSSTNKIETTTARIEKEEQKDSEEDSIIDLTVIIKEPGAENGQKIFYSNHSNSLPTTDLAINVTGRTSQESTANNPTTEIPVLTTSIVTEDETGAASTVTLNHEIVKITVITDKMSTEKSTPVVFEVATLMPVFSNNSDESKNAQASTTVEYTSTPIISTTSSPEISVASTSTRPQQSDPVTAVNKEISVITSAAPATENITVSDTDKLATSNKELGTTHEITDTVTVATTKMLININDTQNIPKNNTLSFDLPANFTEVGDKADLFNHTEQHIDEELEQHDSDMIDDYQSPLLSAANEPLHRPNRSRRPQPPNRVNKFNPFRILG